MDSKFYFTVFRKGLMELVLHFSVNSSSCANSNFYKSYLQLIALSDLKDGRGTTHLCIDAKANRIMGFISLRASSVVIDEDGRLVGSPAIEISVLAVDSTYEKQGVGRTLIDYAVWKANEMRKRNIGVQYMVLIADPKAIGFYEKMGFEPMPQSRYKSPLETFSADGVPMYFPLNFESL